MQRVPLLCFLTDVTLATQILQHLKKQWETRRHLELIISPGVQGRGSDKAEVHPQAAMYPRAGQANECPIRHGGPGGVLGRAVEADLQTGNSSCVMP